MELIVGPHFGTDFDLYVVPGGAQKTAPDGGVSRLGGVLPRFHGRFGKS